MYWSSWDAVRRIATMATYAEYCPITAGAEFFADRWTPLVLRELMMGSHRFNDIHRGIPRISRTLLAQRLRTLVSRGLVEKVDGEYYLTEAGEELQPIVWSLGYWAVKWTFRDPDRDQLDVGWLVWRLRPQLLPDKMPKRRTTIEFRATGRRPGRAWLVAERGEVTACETDPGYDVDLLVRADNDALHRWYAGRADLREEIAAGRIELIGPPRVVRGFPTWIPSHPMRDEIWRVARTERKAS